jgi:large subunit ribosomal protein L23
MKRILLHPLITEKVTKLGEKSIYGFVVAPTANKIEIKRQVETFYSVKVEDVNTMRYAGKKIHRYGKRGLNQGREAAYKKAIVTLQKGDVIDFYAEVK